MSKLDLIKMLVPIFISAIISLVITLIYNAVLKRKEKDKQLLIRRLLKLEEMVSNIRSSIILIDSGKIDQVNGLKMYFIESGKLQVYIKDNKKAMEYEKYHQYYQINSIDKLNKRIYDVGRLYCSNENDEFNNVYRETEIMCSELIELYSIYISQAEYK